MFTIDIVYKTYTVIRNNNYCNIVSAPSLSLNYNDYDVFFLAHSLISYHR